MKSLVFASAFALLLGISCSSKAQNMFIYKDKNGKILTQAQVDELDRKHNGFLIIEFLRDEDPMMVQVIPPTADEMKVIKELRDLETAELKKKWLAKPLPDFSFETLDGKKRMPKDLLGMKTVLFFWSKNDYGSLNQIHALNAWAKNNKDQSVQFWAITFEDSVLITEFLKKHPLSFTHLPNNFSFVMEKMAIMQTPVCMLVDSKGIIRFLTTSTQRNIDQPLKAEMAKIN